jgi:twitching motility protein PilT
MQEIPLQGHYQAGALEALQQSALFGGLQPQDHETILGHGKLYEFAPGETVLEEGQPSDSFWLLVRGKAVVHVALPSVAQPIEISQIQAPSVMGEMGLLLRQSRTASVLAIDELLAVRFHHRAFDLMLNSIKGFTIQLCVTLARRLAQTSRRVPPPVEQNQVESVSPELLRLLPMPFILRHRVLPLQRADDAVIIGFVDEPTAQVLQLVERALPGVQLQPRRIDNRVFSRILQSHGDIAETEEETKEDISVTGSHVVIGKVASEKEGVQPVGLEATLDLEDEGYDEATGHLERLIPLLKRVVAEGASDLYLSAQEKPRWRIGDELYVIEDHDVLAPLAPFVMLSALLPAPRLAQFEAEHFTDFSCTISGLARFRVTLYRAEKGVNAVLRTIPLAPPHPQQLQLPGALRHITKFQDGLVLFSGPPGSGKTTTIAALLEVINHHRSVHIVTLEDPIEYLHTSQKALFHQREIGSHTPGLKQALKHVLRNVPDILVVNGIRDEGALSLLLEIARNRCLVFASMAVRGAVRTIGQVVDMFPAAQQSNARLSLAKVLRCVVSQELCRNVKQGRVAAFEYVSIDDEAAEAIRQGAPQQLLRILHQASGNLALEAHLAQLVKRGSISSDEAYSHTLNREQLDTLLGHALPMLEE